jgi:hypothetical protein
VKADLGFHIIYCIVATEKEKSAVHVRYIYRVFKYLPGSKVRGRGVLLTMILKVWRDNQNPSLQKKTFVLDYLLIRL